MWKWFILLLATLTLSAVVSATGVLFVKPTNDTLCPQQPCHTLEHYAQSWQLYLTSNTVVQFLPGEHVLEGDWHELGVESISNLTLIGSGAVVYNSSSLGIPMATSRISCRGSKTYFGFSYVTELLISRLTFSECDGGEATLLLRKVSHLLLDSVIIQNSTRTGLIGINLQESLIRNSVFMFNQDTNAFSCQGSVSLTYAQCSKIVQNFTLNITSSWILFGNATKNFCASGLYLLVIWPCYNVRVHIHNTTLKENIGGNMFLSLDSFANSIITITDSHFEGGHSLTRDGRGIFMFAPYDASQDSEHSISNFVYINNTEFVGNHGHTGGAMAVYSCTGTELHINGSKFRNNVAGYGGHVAIILMPHCVNTTITISNSLLEDGKATSGNGGGVLVQGRHSTSQCANGNHISISGTRFVGNRAGIYGGAVSLWGCLGTELYIDESEFYDNTTPLSGGHISLELNSENSDYVQIVIVNNSHFESGYAFAGGGISVMAGDGCASTNSTMPKSVYIMNSRVYQNVANMGGGMQLLFNYSCLAIDVLIHNVSFSRNTANIPGGNIMLLNLCTAGNSITISRSNVEFGIAEGGGGMTFLTKASVTCSSSLVRLKPTTISIVHSTFQYNTAYSLGGGLAIMFNTSQYYCCSAEVNISNVIFFNNKITTVSGRTGGPTKGGNILISEDTVVWLKNPVRIHSCLIEGGEAEIGGGILLMRSIAYALSQQNGPEVEGLFISNTQFICNRANSTGASIMAHGIISMTKHILALSTTKKITIINTTFDGTCANSTSVVIVGFGNNYPFMPAGYSVVFINVSFRGYSTNLSSPLSTFHSEQLSRDLSIDDQFILKPIAKSRPGVTLSFVPNATFIDCEFFGSTIDSAVIASGTNMFFGGNISFRDNKATRGAGLRLLDSSVMYLRPNTHVMFSHNYATYAGGAIYVHQIDVSGDSRCFYQFDEEDQTRSDLNIQITFENNTAHFAGSALYGGLVDRCSFTLYKARNISFDSIFKIQNTDDDPTAIASDPFKVCICNDSEPLCDNQLWPVYTYPGALFHVQAVVVGQKDGIVPGVVRATTLGNTSAVLGDLQQSQSTVKSCTTLNYIVFSSQTEETIILVTENNPGRLSLQGLIINVTLLNCPWGFTLMSNPPKCDCADELRNHNIDTCNITTQTITRPPPLWIGYYHSGNNTEPPVEGVLVHDHCPFDYCKPEQLPIHLNNSDKQCAFNHSGILCGACQPGLSLALGTSRCLQCSNKYLMLLFAFAAAGLALVFLLTLINMTVSEGTINGLIFYANIIHINQAIFFPNESTGVNKIILDILSTFISWINLDLGIETCFYNGIDMYTKAWLQFLFPIYIWTIAGGMIISSHYSTTAAKLFRRHAVKVLATLFLLSFAKLQRTIITALSFTFLAYPDGTKTVWLYDSNIEYLHSKHIPLFTAALLALLFLLIPYTLVLFFIQCLSRLDWRIFSWVKKLKPLFDAYTGPYKDRYRFWTGFLLIIRTILFLIFTLGNPGLNLAAIGITSTCLAFSPAVYKKAWLTLLEYSLLLNLSAVSVATFYCRDPQSSGNQTAVVYVSVGAALVTFVAILVYHLCQCTINSRAWKNVSDRVTQRNKNRELVNIAAEGSDEEEEEEPAQAEIRPLMLQFNEYREPVLVYDD